MSRENKSAKIYGTIFLETFFFLNHYNNEKKNDLKRGPFIAKPTRPNKTNKTLNFKKINPLVYLALFSKEVVKFYRFHKPLKKRSILDNFLIQGVLLRYKVTQQQTIPYLELSRRNNIALQIIAYLSKQYLNRSFRQFSVTITANKICIH